MRKVITLFAITLFSAALYSQTTLNFCTYVDAEGYCAFTNNKFITTPDSANGRIFMLVKSTSALGGKLTFKVFTVAKNGEEKISQTLDQTIQPDWFFAWYPSVFATNAKYNVQVFNDVGNMLCSKTFELIAGSR